ncbi:MAG: hypothetical protein N2Z67_10325 [Acetobacteraceae bacterium]|jgi:hypothetical protein|nr:hypothetical protein [Acetobacteraceae bacterium]
MALLRARLVAFDTVSWTAVVRLDGSAAALFESVAVSRALPAAEMVPGRRLLIDTGDHHHPADAVVIAAW